MNEFAEGAVLSGPYPFVREKVSLWDGRDMAEVPTWVPGVRFETCGPEDSEAVADGVGRIILRVVAVFKPGRFPTRVFFTRQWETPDGKMFGKARLRVAILPQFRKLARGYRHDYSMSAKAEESALRALGASSAGADRASIINESVMP